QSPASSTRRCGARASAAGAPATLALISHSGRPTGRPRLPAGKKNVHTAELPGSVRPSSSLPFDDARGEVSTTVPGGRVMYRTAQRTAGEHMWLAMSLAFNLLGIAGVAEDALKWKSFLTNILFYYRRYITDPIHSALAWLWPDFFFPLPYAVSDIAVLMT